MTTWPSGVRDGGERNSGLELRSISSRSYTRLLSVTRPDQPEHEAGSSWSGGVVRITNELENPQGRKSRLLDVDGGVRERDGPDHSSLGLRRGRTDTITRKG